MLTWRGVNYKETSGRHKEGKTIARTKDNKSEVNEVVGDPEHIFVVVRSFLDNHLYVNENYEIPTNGEVTAIYVGYMKVESKDFCLAIDELLLDVATNNNLKTFTVESEGMYQLAEEIYLCFDGCPVGTFLVGYIGLINDTWVYVSNIPVELNPDGTWKTQSYTCYVIDGYKKLSTIKKYITPKR